MKKVFIVFLVFAYLNCYLGCYSSKTTVIPVGEFTANSKWVGVNFDELVKSTNKNSLKVITTDSTEYNFDANTYQFKNDKLYGLAKSESGVVRLSKSEIQSLIIVRDDLTNDFIELTLMTMDSVYYFYEIYERHYQAAVEKRFYKIPINQIDFITAKSSEFSAGETVALIMGIGFMAFAIFIAIVAINPGF